MNFQRIKYYAFLSSLFWFFIFTLLLPAQNRYFRESAKIFDQAAVAEIYIEIHPDHLSYILRPENAGSDSLFPARFIFKNRQIAGDTVKNVGFRLRGNTSRTAKKRSFKIDFNNYEKGLNFYGLEKMNINGEHNDPSILRSMSCWKLFELAGIAASRATYAALFFNGSYQGLYVIVEHIDDEFVAARYPGPTGNLYKCLWPADLNWIAGTGPDRYKFRSYGRQAYALKTNKEADDYSDLTGFIDFLALSTDEEFAREIEEKFNVQAFLRYLALNTLVGMWDDYWFLKNNYYLYHNLRSDKFEFIPYDYDNTYGIDWFDIDWAARDIYQFGPKEGTRPLVRRILAIPAYKNLYSHFIEEFINGIFRKSRQDVYFLGWRILAAPFVQVDPLYSADYRYTYNHHWQNALQQAAEEHVKYGLYDYIDRRIAAARSQLVTGILPLQIFDYSLSNKFPVVGEQVKLYSIISTNDIVQNFELVYSINGGSRSVLNLSPDPDQSNAGPGEAIWSLSLPVLQKGRNMQYFLRARGDAGAWTIFPASAPGDPLQLLAVDESVTYPVVINEFIAANSNVHADAFGEYDDWVELYNPADSSINLSGLFLSDNPQNHRKWALPDTIIQPGEFLLIWADEDSSQGPMHANFKLSRQGEFIGLYAPEAVGNFVIDSLAFAALETDISFGRSPDAAENWIQFSTPTPGVTNMTSAVAGENAAEAAHERFYLTAIYPNPANNAFHIEINSSNSTEINLTIFNINGGVDLKIALLVLRERNEIEINCTTFPTGIYFLLVENGRQRRVKKFTILH